MSEEQSKDRRVARHYIVAIGALLLFIGIVAFLWNSDAQSQPPPWRRLMDVLNQAFARPKSRHHWISTTAVEVKILKYAEWGRVSTFNDIVDDCFMKLKSKTPIVES